MLKEMRDDDIVLMEISNKEILFGKRSFGLSSTIYNLPKNKLKIIIFLQLALGKYIPLHQQVL